MAFYTGRFDSRIEKSYRIETVTPMFLGGADGASAELRVQSIKGMLRFWWRALHPGLTAEELFKKEGRIFGSTEGDIHQKSAFSFYIDEEKSRIKTEMKLNGGKIFRVEHRNITAGIYHYLSVGLFNMKARKYSREHITAESVFILNFIFENDYVKNEVEDALKALITFGGLGAKSRNGFGSLYSEDLQPIIIGDRKKHQLSDYSAFSETSNLYKFSKHDTWQDALSQVGLVYRNMRLSREISIAKHNTALRRFLALPIVSDKSLPNKRHAKPCFLKIAKTADGKFKGQILVMPYKYREPLDNSKNQYDEMIKKMCGVLQKLQNNEKVDTIY
jgi:CRISPR-associated protein Cmr1